MSESIVLMTIGPLLTIVPNIPPLFVGQPGAISFSATGAEGLLRWTLVSIDLPGEWDAALTITDGVASLDAATLANPGSFSVRVRLSDATRIPVEQTFSVRIVALPIEVSGTLDEWTVTVAITDVLTLSGGTGDYVSVTAISGALPAGASVALVGDELQFTGSPTGTVAWSVVLRVTDSAGAYLDIPLSGTVTALPLTITGGPLLDATEGEVYSDTLTISGGVPPYSLGTVTGVPAGLTVDIDGSTIEITGTPDAGESDDSPFSLSIEAEDAEAETEVYTQSFVVADSLTLFDVIEAAAPLAWWKMDETSGVTLADSSGNGLSATVNSNAFVNAAAIFAGAPKSVQIANNLESGITVEGSGSALSITGDLTVLILVNMSFVNDGFPNFIQKPTDSFFGRHNYSLFANSTNGKITGRMNFAGGYYDVTQVGTYATNTPYMLVLRRSGTSLSLWINGVIQGTTTVPSGDADTSSNIVHFARPFGYAGTDDFEGRISCAAIWNRALSDADIEELWELRDE